MAASTNQYQHPLPAAPQQPHFQRPSNQNQTQNQSQAPAGFQYYQPSQQGNDPRAKPRSFSFQSHKSQTSTGSKKDFHETAAEKESRRLTSKADPTLAMNEAEPSAVAAMRSESSTAPLRSMQHKDKFGNAIADPDRSNPTRNRWERPLDTIRSFEAAIDGGYSRKSMYRSETDNATSWNRRSSVATSSFQPRQTHRDSYYGNGSRHMSLRGDGSQYGYNTPGVMTARNSGFFDGQGIHGQSQPQMRQHPRDRQRMPSEQQQYYPPVYPMPHKDRSYETVTSAAGSGNSDPAGYQTDPTSSDNSSIRRASPAKRPEPVNDYGIGFSQQQSYHQPEFTLSSQAQGQANYPRPAPPPHAESAGPPVPRKAAPAVLRRETSRQQQQQPLQEGGDKRKSWFARRFSKNG